MKIEKPLNWLRDVFSWSKLSSFAMCPRKAFLRYIEKVKLMSPDFFIYGRAVHKGQEHGVRSWTFFAGTMSGTLRCGMGRRSISLSSRSRGVSRARSRSAWT
jgi:hypothetical protein